MVPRSTQIVPAGKRRRNGRMGPCAPGSRRDKTGAGEDVHADRSASGHGLARCVSGRPAQSPQCDRLGRGFPRATPGFYIAARKSITQASQPATHMHTGSQDSAFTGGQVCTLSVADRARMSDSWLTETGLEEDRPDMFHWYSKCCRDTAWRSFGLLAVTGPPILFGLSGCLADDGYLTRGGSRVVMPAATPSSKVAASARTPNSNARSSPKSETGSIRKIADKAHDRRFFIAIGRVVLKNHAGDDFFSDPDIFVQVQRRDPDILHSIRLAEARLSTLGKQGRATQEELRPLVVKQRNSEITPGEPLSQTRVRRLADLSRDLGNMCDDAAKRRACRDCGRYDERPKCQECRDCDELRFLLELKSASELVPGPPLSPAEEERLRELKEASARISKDKQATTRDVQRLRDEITGKTHTVTTPGFTLDFGFRAIQEVFPKDELWISVYDDDLNEDDLYGSTALRLGDELLHGGDVTVAMPNVRSLVLRIVSR